MKNQKGLILVYTLVLLALVGILISPLLGYVSTSVRAQKTRETSSGALYAADAGVEDGIWQMEYDHLTETCSGYNEYDYSANYTYSLPTSVNDNNVNVTINNVWLPSDIAAPSPSSAESIINDQRFILTGKVLNSTFYQLFLTYNNPSDKTVPSTFKIGELGIWFPYGFSYVPQGSNLENDTTKKYYPLSVTDVPCAGNQAVIFKLNNVSFSDFPNVSSTYPKTTTITFKYTSDVVGKPPRFISWVKTTGISGMDYYWDADKNVYKIVSEVIGTTTSVEAYIVNSKTRELSTTINGDYIAAGNSLMITSGANSKVRDKLLSSSKVIVSTIPTDARVDAAYLYWSAFLHTTNKATATSRAGNAVSFKIGNNTAQIILPTKVQLLSNPSSSPFGYSYSCFQDITELVY